MLYHPLLTLRRQVICGVRYPLVEKGS